MNFLRSEKFKIPFLSAVLVAFGITFCVSPIDSFGTIEVVCAVLLNLVGIVFVIAFCFAPDFARSAGQLFVGAVSIAIGIIIAFVPSTLVLGACVLGGVLGTHRILLAVDTKTLGDKKYYIDLIFGLIIYVLSMVLLVLNMTALPENIVIIAMGACMIAFGVMLCLVTFALKRNNANLVKLLEDCGVYFDENSENQAE